MNVLSLFDGMSCGQIALERAGIKVDNYHASEIDKYAIKVAMANYPDTIQLGDICEVKGNDLPKIDLLIGRSPCQGFSFAGKQLNFNDIRSKLFFEYVRLLGECKPKYFLLENVKMKKECQDVISEYLGIEPMEINSALVSAQNRKRLYWTNIPDICQPEDKNIKIDDILESGIDIFLPRTRQEYSNYDISKIDKSINKNTPIILGSSKGWGCSIRNNAKAYTVRKAECNGFIDKNLNIRKFTPIETERLQSVPDNYTLCDGVTKTKRYEMLGNGWTIDIIAHIFKGLKEDSKCN